MAMGKQSKESILAAKGKMLKTSRTAEGQVHHIEEGVYGKCD
jgi:hypothetical protein